MSNSSKTDHSSPISVIAQPDSIVSGSINNMTTDGWSRVSPLAIIYFFAKAVWGLGNSLLYILPVAAINFSSVKENWFIALIAIACILTLMLFSSIVNYWFYHYKFAEDRVEIKQGVFKKSHLDIPFKKIQNVKIIQPFYYRFKQYSFIELDTAGSAQQEAKIVALPLVLAQKFKQLILQIKQAPIQQDTATHASEQNTETEVLLNERSVKDLIIHGISNNRVWIILGFLAPFYNRISETIGEVLDSMGFDLIAYLDYQSQSIGLFLLHVFSLVMLVMLIIVSFSVIGSIFVFYKYRLSRQGERYIRRSGLFTKHEISMRLSRIQIAVQQQDWLDVLINRTNLRFEQNSSGSNSNSQTAGVSHASKLIVPSVTPLESIALIQDVFDVKRFTDIKFVAISKRYMLRLVVVFLIPLIALMTFAALASKTSFYGWLVVGALSLLLGALVYIRWWRWGYYFDKSHIYIRKGLLGVNYCVFPIGKTQQVAFKQSVFMRRHKLSSVRYVLASGAYSIPFIPERLALKQASDALFQVAKYKPAWM